MSNLNCENVLKTRFIPSNYNILIIENSKSINKIIKQKFEEYGFKCFSAYTIEDAKIILEEKNIHYIILDLYTNDKQSSDFINSLKNRNEKIFVLTSEKDTQLRTETFKKGIIDFIIKDTDFFHKITTIPKSIEQLEKNKEKTILVVDDSRVIQSQLNDIFTNRNYNVKIASNEQEALEIIKNYHLDLILLDVQLKEGNGIRFLRSNKNEIINVKNIPVLILSSSIDSITMRDGLKAGASDLLRKPYILEELILKVDLWIDYKRRSDELKCSTKLLEEYKNAVDESAIVSKTLSDGTISYVNRQFCEISGYCESELIGKNQNIIRHPDMNKEVFRNLWKTIKEEKKPWKGKIKNRKKDGSFYIVEALIKPILDSNGEIVEFIGIRNDITEEEKLKDYFKEKLHCSEKDLNVSIKLSQEYERAINESSILSRIDTNRKISYVNDKFEKHIGYSKEELIGKDHTFIWHEDMSEEIYKELWDTVEKGETYSTILKNKKKDGTKLWHDTTVVPIKNDKNEIIEYMIIRHELTELFNLHKEIEDTQKDVVYKMGEIGETRSKETGNHVKRVAEYSKTLALLAGLSKHEAKILFTASPMHDIGKVAIPDSILKKPGKLTPDEFEIMKTHAEIGYSILKGSKREVLEAAAIVSYEHHEKWDGSGYPRGLEGENIHIYGRITAIADVFDALGSDRCYKKAWDDEDIFKLFIEQKAKHFDPKLIDLFLEHKEKFIEIREMYSDDIGYVI